jgi:hypothetical protein
MGPRNRVFYRICGLQRVFSYKNPVSLVGVRKSCPNVFFEKRLTHSLLILHSDSRSAINAKRQKFEFLPLAFFTLCCQFSAPR